MLGLKTILKLKNAITNITLVRLGMLLFQINTRSTI